MLAMTTSVTLQILKALNSTLKFVSAIISGMARAVVDLTLAVPSTTLHGL